MVEVKLPKEFIKGDEVRKMVLTEIDEIQYLCVEPHTTITMHGHDDQWEVWIWLEKGEAFICPKGNSHELINESDGKVKILAIKGCQDYSYVELATFFAKLGLVPHAASLKIA